MKILAEKNSSCHFVSSALHFFYFLFFFEKIIGKRGDLSWQLPPRRDHRYILVGLQEKGF